MSTSFFSNFKARLRSRPAKRGIDIGKLSLYDMSLGHVHHVHALNGMSLSRRTQATRKKNPYHLIFYPRTKKIESFSYHTKATVASNAEFTANLLKTQIGLYEASSDIGRNTTLMYEISGLLLFVQMIRRSTEEQSY